MADLALRLLVVTVLTLLSGVCSSVAVTAERESPAFTCGVVRPHPQVALASVPDQAPVSSTGNNRLIFFRARFPDDQSDPITREEAEQTLQEVNEILRRNSYGKFSLSWDISPVLHLSKTRETYNGPGGFDAFLTDVREAGLAVGYDYRQYELDLVRHSGVPDFMGGNANLGARGAQVQAPGAVIIVHELGHNLGLSHANVWTTGALGLSRGSPPMPSNYETLPDPRTIPVYPDSALGHETITGPGYSTEYGDTTDIMGSGTVEFSGVYRFKLGWLPESEMALAGPGATTNVVQAPDGARTGLPRIVRVSRVINSPAGQREYWIQLPAIEPNAPNNAGVHIRWADPGGQGSLLLAPLGSTPGAGNGTVLPPGKTFSDREADLHITALAVAGEGSERRAEIAVVNGSSLLNRPPIVSFNASAPTTAVDQSVTFTAIGADPDGDGLVWRWDFGDGTSSMTPSSVVKSWRREGDFLVYLEVSDLRGGVARAHGTVRVGSPNTFRISGRVLDSLGQPVAGARVHNGISGRETQQRVNVTTFSDSSGAYTLTGLSPGVYTNGAFLFGYTTARQEPVTITDRDLMNVDFVATPLPQVSVSAPVQLPESAGISDVFVFTRSGSTAEPLTVLYTLGGSAAPGRDYARPFVDRVVIPAGASSAALSLDIFDDTVGELDETITLQVSHPTSAQRQDSAGNLYTVYYPGWELALINGQMNWVLTDPSYIPALDSTTSITIRDNDSARAQTVAVSASDLIAIEDPRVESSFTISRSGQIDVPLNVDLSTSGSAREGADYAPLPTSIRFEPGEIEKVIAVQAISDDSAEPEEEIVLSILPRPEYGIELNDAKVRIRDSAAAPLTVTGRLMSNGALQLTMKGQAGSRLLLESSSDFTQWMPIRTNLLFNTDTAVLAVPVQKAGPQFFRTVRLP